MTFDGIMIEQKLVETASEAIRQLYHQEISPDQIGLERTKKEIEGDFTLLVFPMVKFSRKSPEITAAEIGDFLCSVLPELRDYKVIKGFLNIHLRPEWWLKFLRDNMNEPDFGFQPLKSGSPVLIEYSSPNTNKPLHLGHIRNNLLGYSLSEIARANGNQVVKMNLINDRGIHICKSMLAYLKWGLDETPDSSGIKGDHLVGKYYVLFNQNLKSEVKDLMDKGLTEEEALIQAPLNQEAQEMLRKWEAQDTEIISLWKTMNSWVYDGFNETYCNLGVNFDKIYYESDTYLLGKEIVRVGLEKGLLLQKDDGSIWADLNAVGLDEKLLLRADGTSVYMTQDIGTAELRYREYHPSGIIYVVGNEQNYHFDVLKQVLKKLGKPYSAQLFHLSYGMVELPSGKMKSREGTVVDADDLIREMVEVAEKTTRELGKANDYGEKEGAQLFRQIGLGALKYFILKVDPKKNMLFDPQESIDFNGNTGPFIQYTHARIRSMLKKGLDAGFQFRTLTTDGIDLMKTELNILKILYQFPVVVRESWSSLSPAIIANYIYELAREYNQFYQEIPVLKEKDKEKTMLRLALTSFTGNVIRKGMSLLGIESPEKM